MADLTQYGYFTNEHAKEVADHFNTWYGLEDVRVEPSLNKDNSISHWRVSIWRGTSLIMLFSQQQDVEMFLSVVNQIAEIDSKAAQV